MKRHKTENKAIQRKGDGITALIKAKTSPKVLISKEPADTAVFLKQNWINVSKTSVKARNKNILRVTCLFTVILFKRLKPNAIFLYGDINRKNAVDS
jgi:hypothetical protein